MHKIGFVQSWMCNKTGYVVIITKNLCGYLASHFQSNLSWSTTRKGQWPKVAHNFLQLRTSQKSFFSLTHTHTTRELNMRTALIKKPKNKILQPTQNKITFINANTTDCSALTHYFRMQQFSGIQQLSVVGTKMLRFFDGFEKPVCYKLWPTMPMSPCSIL